MRKSFGSLLLAIALSWAAAGASPAQAVDNCPNAALRIGTSATLPDCRGYELVSGDLNHARLSGGGAASADGSTVVYVAVDAPGTANSGQPFANDIRAKRDATGAWSNASLSPPLAHRLNAYYSFVTAGVSSDLSSTFQFSDQPLSGENVPDGQNAFIGRPDGSYQLLTSIGTPPSSFSPYSLGRFIGGSSDFSHVYFEPYVAQLPSDPVPSGNLYTWSEDRGLALVGFLPDGTPAPHGVTLPGGLLQAFSSDGKYVVFNADSTLYVRVDGSHSIELGPVSINVSDPHVITDVAGVTADGAKVLFTSQAELTPDANTGVGHVGRNLYSYDTASGDLTDLTVDTDPGDVAGADVQRVLAASPGGSYIYFTANGSLGNGAGHGHTSLYVWHNGTIDFVSELSGVFRQNGGVDPPRVYLTPDGRHLIFSSLDSLTGYDNADPATGQLHAEVFEASRDSSIVCVSCRVNGSPPTSDSDLPAPGGILAAPRAASDDGRRIFFESRDAIVPQASSGRQQVYEYADGGPAPISRLDSASDALYIDTSASGDDVFFSTFDDLLPGPAAGDNGVFDARVGGGTPAATVARCSGEACHGSGTPAPGLAPVATITFLGDGNAPMPSTNPRSNSKVTASKVKTITGTAGLVKVKVPGKGRLMVTGLGLQSQRLSLSRAQTVSVRLALTEKASKTLRRRRSFSTKVKVAFSRGGAEASTATLTVTFKVASARKGR